MLKICYARRGKRSGIGEETVGNDQSQKEQLEPGDGQYGIARFASEAEIKRTFVQVQRLTLRAGHGLCSLYGDVTAQCFFGFRDGADFVL